MGSIVRDHGAGFTRLPTSAPSGYHQLLTNGLPSLMPRTSIPSRDVVDGTAPRKARKENGLAAARLEKRCAVLPTVERLAALPW